MDQENDDTGAVWTVHQDAGARSCHAVGPEPKMTGVKLICLK
jgi:hypothetical protein